MKLLASYNYRWSIEKQKRKAENRLIVYLQKVVAKYSPFYREWFQTHNIDPQWIDSLADFQKIPPTTKSDHMKNPEKFILKPYKPEWWECNFVTEPLSPFQSFKYWLKALNKTYLRGVFAKEPVGEEERIIMEAVNEWLPVHFHNTRGSKQPALIAYTKRDLLVNIPEIVAHLYMTGFRANWEVFNIMPASPSVSFFQSVWAPLSVGGGTFFTCGDKQTSPKEQFKLANNITFEMFLGTPTLTKKWLTSAIEKLSKKEINKISSFKICILTGEPLLPETEAEIKSLFAELGSTPEIIESYTNNRTKGTFYECSENSGVHLNPRYFYWEVLDKKSLEPVEAGEPGYLCFSHIDWRGTVFIRYNTGDLIDGLVWETCDACGLTFPKIKGSIKRSLK